MRAHNFKNLTGQRFGRLVAIDAFVQNGKTRWRCMCDCGNETAPIAQHLGLGLTKSCGCLRKETSAKQLSIKARKHGLSKEPWYQVWRGMMTRCYKSNGQRFHRYGGRGIDVCVRWHDPETFFADMGMPPDGKSIDRINNDHGYSPENCRWSTDIEQNNNRRSTTTVSFNGVTQSPSQWARQLGITKATMYYRLKTWPIDRALTTPPLR